MNPSWPTRLSRGLLIILVRGFLSFLGLLATALRLRRNEIVLFSQSRGRYSGNSKFLFESICGNRSAFWLYEDRSILDRIPLEIHEKFVARYGLRGIWLSMRARYIILSHGSGDFGLLWFCARSARVVMLWHAIGIKYAGRLTGNISDHGRSLYKNKEVSYYDILICSSDIDRYYTASFQGVDVEKVHVTGLPKADNYILMRERYEDQRLLHGGIINILYAPTFRDFPIDRPLFFPFGDFTVEALSAMLEEFANVRLFLRAHPNDLHSLEYAAELQARLPGVIKNISFDVLDDIDEVLHQFDVIITDYSSIYMEPLLHDIPVIFVNHDFDQYVKTRGLAYPYDIVTPGPKVKTFKGFRQEVAEAIEGAPRWRAQRAAVREMFFKHKDNGSCERISRLIS